MRTLKLLMFGLFLAPTAGFGTEVYRAVDESGDVIYTDQPSDGAEKITVQDAQTISLPPAPEFSYTPPAAIAGAYYTAVSISTPADDSTIRIEEEDIVRVNVAVQPSLAGNDTVVLFLNGQEVDSGNRTAFDLPNVERGTHRLTATIRGPDGSIRGESAPSTFHMQRVSVLHNNPPPGPPKPKS